MRTSSADKLAQVDVVIFDCDGVLVDTRASYDRAIEVTLAHFLANIFGLKLNATFLAEQLVEALRGTGQYNNDIDATAAILVSITANLPSAEVVKGLQSLGVAATGLQNTFDSEGFANRTLTLTDMASQGLSSFVDKVKAKVPNLALCIDGLLERLAYPGGPASSSLTRVFDEYYYGPALLKQLHGIDSVIGCKTGLIDSESVLASKETLRSQGM